MTYAEQIARARELSSIHLEAIEAAIAKQDEELARLARQAIGRIKASGYDPRVTKQTISQLFRDRSDVLSQRVTAAISDAAALPERVEAVARAHGLEGVRPIVTGAEIAEGRVAAKQVERAAMAAEVPGTGSTLTRATERPATRAERILNRVAPAGKQASFSESLHGDTKALTEGSQRAIGRAIREMINADAAGKALIQATSEAGGMLGAKQRVPKLLQEYVDALRRIDRVASLSPDEARIAHAELEATRRKLDRYVSGLAERRGGYLEFRQIIDAKGPAGVDRALERWLSEKQRYNAERIMRTETAAARRIAEHEKRKDNPLLIGYVWRLSTRSRKGFEHRTSPTMKPPKGIHGRRDGGGTRGRCMCEFMAGRVFGRDLPEKWPRGAHPQCLCWYEPIFNGLAPKDVTERDLEQL